MSAALSSPSLGLVEVPHLSITAVLTDELLQNANVQLLGIETTGNENLMIRFQGDVGSIEAALIAAETKANALGTTVILRNIPRPETSLERLIHFPNSSNPLYGGRDQLLSNDYPLTTMNTPQHALGFLETQGLTASLEAADAMLKAANVALVGKEKIGAAYVTIMIRGEVGAVKAAIDAGSQAVGHLGKLIAAHVIARPHSDLIALLPK